MALLVGAQAAQARDCPDFIVGQANSTAYDEMKLPGTHVSAEGISCAEVRHLARAFHRGTVKVADSGSGKWGKAFKVKYRGRAWSCQFWSVGMSGPSYRIRCSWHSRRAAWRAG